MWIEVIFFRGAKPPQGCPLVAKKSFGKYPSTSSLWFHPILKRFFRFFVFFNGFKNGFFTGFGPRHAAGLAERPFFIFHIIIYHPKEHSLWFSAQNSKILQMASLFCVVLHPPLMTSSSSSPSSWRHPIFIPLFMTLFMTSPSSWPSPKTVSYVLASRGTEKWVVGNFEKSFRDPFLVSEPV